jgi:hypothetical protein
VNRPAIREVLDSMHLYIGESDLRGGALQYREDHEESDGTCCTVVYWGVECAVGADTAHFSIRTTNELLTCAC